MRHLLRCMLTPREAPENVVGIAHRPATLDRNVNRLAVLPSVSSGWEVLCFDFGAQLFDNLRAPGYRFRVSHALC